MTYVRAGLGVLLVCFAPGALIVIVARVRVSALEALAAIPACSLAAVFLIAEMTTLVRIPFGPGAFFVVLVALAAAALIAWRARGRPTFAFEAAPTDYDDNPSDARIESAPRFTSRAVLALGLLVLAVVAGASSWAGGIHDSTTIPGNFDASQHGFMTARVADAGSIAASDVLVSDVKTSTTATNYYPLATHASAALVHRIAGVDVSLALTMTLVFFAAFVLPVGIYVLVRFLWPTEPLAAGFAALLGAWLVSFPYKPADWGGIPLILGMTLVPISVLLLTRTLLSRWSAALTALTALVLAGGFAVHNSQLPIIVLFSVLLVVEHAVRARHWPTVTAAARRLVLVAIGVLVFFVPTLPTLVQGGSDRAEFTDRAVTSVESVLGPLLTLHFSVNVRQGWLAMFALAGIVLVVWQRRLWSWVGGCATIVALTLVAGTTQHGVAWLTFLWYRQPERVAYNLIFFVPVFGGIALGFVVGWLSDRLPARRFAIPACTIGGLVLVVLATGVQAARATRAQVRASFESPIQPIAGGSLAAFRYLRGHAGDGLVVNDLNIDGSLWMYAFDGVRPMFALWPTGGYERDRDYRQRLYIHDHIEEAGTNRRLTRLMQKYDVEFVYWGRTPFIGAEHEMDLASLRASPGLEEDFTSGDASVFRVR